MTRSFPLARRQAPPLPSWSRGRSAFRASGAALVALAAWLGGCGSRAPAAEDAGPAVAPPPPPAKAAKAPPVRSRTPIVSPLFEEVTASETRFAGFRLPRDFEVTQRTGTRVVLQGARAFQPVRRYLDQQLVTPPTRASEISVLFEHALPRGAEPTAQRLQIFAHTISTSSVRLDLRLEQTAESIPAGRTLQDRLRASGWGPNLTPPRDQNQ